MTAPRPDLPADVLPAIEDLAREPRLLVATDFDGTMAQIVPVPSDAAPDPDTVRALRALSRMPHTTVAVVSGRSLEVLHQLTGLAGTAHLVGSHGMEFDSEFEASLSDHERSRLAEINRRAALLLPRYEGLEVEQKPASTAVHYRHVTEEHRPAVLAEIASGPSAVEGSHVTTGKMVVEIAAVRTSKGDALDRLRRQDDAGAVVFLGDDVTDEDAFVRLSGRDVGVKVGPGQSAARLRIEDTGAVARFLELLAVRRLEVLGAGPVSS